MKYYSASEGIKVKIEAMDNRHLNVAIIRISNGWHPIYKQNGYKLKALIREFKKRDKNGTILNYDQLLG